MKYFKTKAIPNLKLKELSGAFDDSNWEVFRIPQLFHPLELESALQNLLSAHNVKSKDKSQLYQGLCLQSAMGDQDPLFDQLDSIAYYDSTNQKKTIREVGVKINQLTSAGSYFNFVFQIFENRLPLQRGRLLLAAPGTLLTRHSDGPKTAALHIPLLSNPQSHIVVNESEYFLEPDGSAYLVNTEHLHFMYNAGETDRYHLVFTLFLKTA